MNNKEVPVWEKPKLTLEEDASCSGIGIYKLGQLCCLAQKLTNQ